MYAQKEKSKVNKSRAVANSVGQNRSNTKQSFGFIDNRPESVAQRKLQKVIGAHSHKENQKKVEGSDYQASTTSQHMRAFRDKVNMAVGTQGYNGEFKDVSGQGVYAKSSPSTAIEITDLLSNIYKKKIDKGDRAKTTSKYHVKILTGTHGDDAGNLVQGGGKGVSPKSVAGSQFYSEDVNTAVRFKTLFPLLNIDVVDVKTKNRGQIETDIADAGKVNILAWCFGSETYKNKGTFTVDW